MWPHRVAAFVATVATLAIAGAALAWTAAEGQARLAAIEARWNALSRGSRRDARALAELDRRASALAQEASRALGAMREDAAERDADMAAVVASDEWQTTEALLVKLRFRIASIELERALAGDPDRKQLALAAADGFSPFVEAPDAVLAAESRYGRGLARIAAGDRGSGMDDLRAAARASEVAPRARLALAETLADGGDRATALDLVSKQLAAGGLPRELALRAKLLRLRLLASARAEPAASDRGRAATAENAVKAPADVPALVSDLLAAGDPWREAALSLLRENEHLLPTGPDADATVLRLRADAAARAGDAATALGLYREAVARDAAGEDAAALEGVARAALATGAWDEARGALARLRAQGRPATRELALIDLRAAYGAWQASPDAERTGALAVAAAAVAGAEGATADDRAEASYRGAEAARAAADLDGAIAAFAAIDALAWRTAAHGAELQCRVLRHAREPEREPRDPLLRDLGEWIASPDLPEDARALAIVLDATLRTSGAPAGPPDGLPSAEPALDPAEQRAALARLREFPARHPSSASLLPAVLRTRALLELDVGATPEPTMLEVLSAPLRPDVAAQIAGDLRDEVAASARLRDEAGRARARRALDGALGFAALAPEGERAEGRLALAESALALGDAATADALFRAELRDKPSSLSTLRGLARAAAARGDAAGAKEAWGRLAAMPDLPAALREEVDRELAGPDPRPD